MFEDICLSHNNRQSIEGEDKISNKLKNFFNRCIITNSYSLLESYLNGIAFEHYIYNKEMLNENEKKILIEWDNVTKRINNVSLRDKVIKYPKIISGKTVPIYTEENSKEMNVIFNKYRLYRDSIIHASPIIGEISKEKFNKESYFLV